MTSAIENHSSRFDTLELSQRLLSFSLGKDQELIPDLLTAQLSIMEILAGNDLNRRRTMEILKTDNGLRDTLCFIIERDNSELLASRPKDYKIYEEIRCKAFSLLPLTKCYKVCNRGCPIVSEITLGKDGKDPKIFHSLISFLEQDIPEGINRENLQFFQFAVFSKALGVELLSFIAKNHGDSKSVRQILSKTMTNESLKKMGDFFEKIKKIGWNAGISRIIEQSAINLKSLKK